MPSVRSSKRLPLERSRQATGLNIKPLPDVDKYQIYINAKL